MKIDMDGINQRISNLEWNIEEIRYDITPAKLTYLQHFVIELEQERKKFEIEISKLKAIEARLDMTYNKAHQKINSYINQFKEEKRNAQA